MNQLQEIQRREADAADDAAVLDLMTQYMTWALATFERTYGFAMTAVEAQHTGAALAAFRRPSGLLVLAEVDGAPAGVAALRAQDDGVVEIKRMFVRPELQGRHVGSAMLDRLLEQARDDLGARVVRLDSNRFMTGAHRLYESRGFVERDPYPGSEIPAELQHLWRFYERALG
ncbi:GNAT family N-acetyltransferase [Promicromonospora kroppenstedtii]|uniref:GNAT family N-acetyltransferase n=1 Tax=Promicromonospora kroppenstedtii TaxID=440482 RepID=UPI0004B0FEAD|nr:GNAT family N-acetyltransferase [Promicromonospora kroppenstedtii]